MPNFRAKVIFAPSFVSYLTSMNSIPSLLSSSSLTLRGFLSVTFLAGGLGLAWLAKELTPPLILVSEQFNFDRGLTEQFATLVLSCFKPRNLFNFSYSFALCCASNFLTSAAFYGFGLLSRLREFPPLNAPILSSMACYCFLLITFKSTLSAGRPTLAALNLSIKRVFYSYLCLSQSISTDLLTKL